MQDIVIAGLVVPAVVSAVVSGLWGYFKERELTRLKGDLERDLETFKSRLQGEQEALKSRLQREQEAFRLVHSPRVTGAVKLWAAFCELERCLRSLVAPIVADPQWKAERLGGDAWSKVEASLTKDLVKAWSAVRVARDEAEVLLPGSVYAEFELIFNLCNEAFAAWSPGRMTGEDGSTMANKMLELLNTAVRQRPAAVEAIRKLIAEPLG